MSHSQILELDRLTMGFDQMAASLEEVEERRREIIDDLTH